MKICILDSLNSFLITSKRKVTKIDKIRYSNSSSNLLKPKIFSKNFFQLYHLKFFWEEFFLCIYKFYIKYIYNVKEQGDGRNEFILTESTRYNEYLYFSSR